MTDNTPPNSIKFIKFDGDQQSEIPVSNGTPEISNDEEQIFARFAKWLEDRGVIGSQSTPFSIYNHSSPQGVILQDEEKTIGEELPTEDENFEDVDIPEDPEADELMDDSNEEELPPRVVDGAHLVYKRKGDEGTYEELWIYNVTPSSTENMKIKDKILAGTDIEPTKTQSEDGTQQYDFWAIGNAHMIKITGLPN